MRDRELIFRKQNHYNFLWIMICFLLTIFFLIIVFYEVPTYYHTMGIIQKGEKNVSILLESSELHKIYNAEVIINHKKIEEYELVVSDFISTEGKIYNQVNIVLDYEFDEEIVNVSFELPKTRILEKIWKGMME